MILVFTLINFVVASSDVSCNNAYCLSCTEDKSGCTGCIPNYILVEKECIYKRKIGCERFDDKTYNCTKCSDGYKFDYASETCVTGKETCNDYIMSSTCKSCISGYLRGLTKCMNCSESNKYCLGIEGDNCLQCNKCDSGTKNENGICVLVDEFCYNLTSDGVCQECHYGYYFEGGKCQKGSNDICFLYKSKDICEQCFSGYVVEGGVCLKDPLCESTKKSACGKCIVGYGLVNGKCEKCNAANCYNCDEDISKCSSCVETNSLIIGNDCVKCSPIGCETCVGSDPNNCETCLPGYGKLNNECVKCPLYNCSICDGDNPSFCKGCLDGFFLGPNICFKIREGCTKYDYYKGEEYCFSCSDNYILENGNCAIKPCLNKDENTGKCIDCNKGYYMTKDYQCLKCDAKCINGCEDSESNCILVEENRKIESCNIYDKDYSCTHCFKGHSLVEGKCKSDYENCVEVTATGKCTLCQKGESDAYWPNEDFTCVDSAFNVLTLLVALIVFMM